MFITVDRYLAIVERQGSARASAEATQSSATRQVAQLQAVRAEMATAVNLNVQYTFATATAAELHIQVANAMVRGAVATLQRAGAALTRRQVPCRLRTGAQCRQGWVPTDASLRQDAALV